MTPLRFLVFRLRRAIGEISGKGLFDSLSFKVSPARSFGRSVNLIFKEFHFYGYEALCG